MSLGATTSAPASACEIAVLRKELERDVVVHLAVADDAAVPVRRVLAQAYVGDHDELGVGLLQGSDGHLDDPLGVVGARCRPRPSRRDAEEDHGADAGRLDLGRLGDELGDREPLHAGHRRHLLAHALAGDDEQRLHEVLRGQIRLAHQVAQCLRAPQAAHAGGGKAHPPDSRAVAWAGPAGGGAARASPWRPPSAPVRSPGAGTASR